jgi:hypothetical protein
MNCPKCHIDGDRWDEHERHIQEKDFDVEMEDKGETFYQKRISENSINYDIPKHLHQCPVCRNIEIQ